MTLEECGEWYDVDISYSHNDRDHILPDGWQWNVNCGYQAFWSSKAFETPQEAYENLLEWLKTWEGPTK